MNKIINLPKKQPESPKPSYEDVLKAANKLTSKSHPDKIASVLKSIAEGQFDPLRRATLIHAVQQKMKLPKKTLEMQVKVFEQELGYQSNDFALNTARAIRKERFNAGRHLKRTSDGSYWSYHETHWLRMIKASLRKVILEECNKVFHLYEGSALVTLINLVWSCLDDLLGVDEGFFNPLGDVPSIINVENGELWNGNDGSVELRPHSSESGLTYCLPIKYDPKAKCPRYDKALEEIFSEAADTKEMVRHWHEFVGYVVQQSRNIPCFWLLIGHGANGKTRLLQTLQRLLGPDAVMNDSIAKFMRDRFNVAYLIGKYLFIDDDLTEGVELDDGLLKQISEGKRMSARRAYGRDKVDFVCRAVPVMAGNSFPVVKDVSHGMARRAYVIPFEKVFSPEEQDLDLFPAIWENEMAGVLNQALEGYKRIVERGHRFDPPQECIDAHREFFMHANPLVRFISEMCEHDPDARLRLRDMRVAIKIWTFEQGLKRPPVADKTLKRKLVGMGYKVSKVKGYETVFGLGLKLDAEKTD